MYSEATVREIERRYEMEIAKLRDQKTTIRMVERIIDERTSEALQIVDVRESVQGLYIRVR